MTSVQNPLLPLNGNKFIVAIFCCLVIFSCSKKNNQTSTNTSTTDSSVSVPVGERPRDTINPVFPDSILNSNLFSYKDTYNIGVMLPFYLDSFMIYDDGFTTQEYERYKKRELHKPSTLAIEYYKGVRLALDSLQRLGLKLNVHVFDCFQKGGIPAIIKSHKLDSMNLIIGPIYNSHLTELAPYCLQHKIPFVSPLSPSTDITSNNGYFYIANPSLSVHVQNMFNFAMDNFEDDKLIVVYQDNDNERLYLREMRAMYTNYHKENDLTDNRPNRGGNANQHHLADTIMPFTEVPVPWDAQKNLADLDASKLELVLDPNRHNVIILPTVDMSLIQLLSQKLHKLNKDISVTVIGTPVWSKESELRFEYLESFEVYYTSPIYLDSNYYKTAFYNNHLEDYGYEPPVYTIRAYDLTLFYGQMLYRYGLNFTDLLPIEYYNGLHTNYKFAPVYPSMLDTTSIKYFENQFVHILHYEPNGLRKVN